MNGALLLALAGAAPARVWAAACAVAFGSAIAVLVWSTLTDPRSALAYAAARYTAHLARMLAFLRSKTAPRAVLLAQVGGAASAATLAVAFALPPLGVAAALAVVVPPWLLRRKVDERRKRIDQQADGFAQALANALRSSPSIVEAVQSTVEVSPEPLRSELEVVVKSVRLGSSFSEALEALSAKVQAPSLDVVISSVLLGRQLGGEVPRILETTAGSLRELKRLEAYTEKVVAGAKQSVLVASLLTLGLALGLPVVVPGFLDPLLTTPRGNLILAQLAGVYVLALALAYRFTRVDV